MLLNPYLEGLRLFEEHRFFDAHEVLEDVWRAAPEPDRKFLQGLIQVAVALHHHSRGNLIGCQSLLDRARRNLSAYPETYLGLDLSAFLHSIDQWRTALAGGHPVPAFPVMRVES
jgi:uncharacterized protein